MKPKPMRGGYFSLEGKKGASLAVTVVKEGYRVIKEPLGSIRFWEKGAPGSKLPNKEEPFLYILRKKGEAAELIYLPYGRYKLAKDGTPMVIALKTGKAAVTRDGDLQVECWIDDQNKDEKEQYDWRCRISVPGGGLAPWKGEEGFEFEAPAGGYQRSVEINMPKTAERWLDQVEQKYFVKTGDGKYARLVFRLFAASKPFCVLKVHYNPSGSRNLEYDPAKEIKIPKK